MGSTTEVDWQVAYRVAWKDEFGKNLEVFRTRAEADAQAANVRTWDLPVKVAEEDVAQAVLDEMEDIRTRWGLVPANEWEEDEASWPVWVVQHTTPDGLDWEEPRSSREEADAFAAAVVSQGDTIKGIFIFDAFDAVIGEVTGQR